MSDLILSSTSAYLRDDLAVGYCAEVPYDPPQAYPELPFLEGTNPANRVYSMVRDLFIRLQLDREHVGTGQWNPLREVVRPGDKVLIKPNLVTPRHYLGRAALSSSIVQGAFLRPIIDYAALALNGDGAIVIADNPIEIADFRELMGFTGIQDMVDVLRSRGYGRLSVIDLRPRVSRESADGRFVYESQPGDPLGYKTIDLGKDSLFGEFDGRPGVHYYTLADQAVDHFDPRFCGESTTDQYHNPQTHRYVVSRSVLDADVLINVAKMKTHCKAGVTLSLKNLIGMVHLKDCMPHHRPGRPPFGDSFPDFPARHFVASRKLYRSARRRLRLHRFPGFRSFRNFLQHRNVLIQQHIEHGNWKGNDTIWRTILDLNRIAVYADKRGTMQETPQRRFLVLIDGIISQEGDGPMSGRPVTSSIIFGGFNPVAVDTLAIKSMGINPGSIPTVANAAAIKRWPLFPRDGFDLRAPGSDPPRFGFALPKGWR